MQIVMRSQTWSWSKGRCSCGAVRRWTDDLQAHRAKHYHIQLDCRWPWLIVTKNKSDTFLFIWPPNSHIKNRSTECINGWIALRTLWWKRELEEGNIKNYEETEQKGRVQSQMIFKTSNARELVKKTFWQWCHLRRGIEMLIICCRTGKGRNMVYSWGEIDRTGVCGRWTVPTRSEDFAEKWLIKSQRRRKNTFSR